MESVKETDVNAIEGISHVLHAFIFTFNLITIIILFFVKYVVNQCTHIKTTYTLDLFLLFLGFGN